MRCVFLVLGVLMVGCNKPQTLEDFSTTDLTLPSGRVIKVETKIMPADLAQGMKFRTSLAPDHGMLFIHPKPGTYPYGMYQVTIPLDIIWIDRNRTIIQMVLNADPCTTGADKCPQYATGKPAQFVLELAGGTAKKYNLQIGQKIEW